jgi:hypothetical protein
MGNTRKLRELLWKVRRSINRGDIKISTEDIRYGRIQLAQESVHLRLMKSIIGLLDPQMPINFLNSHCQLVERSPPYI